MDVGEPPTVPANLLEIEDLVRATGDRIIAVGQVDTANPSYKQVVQLLVRHQSNSSSVVLRLKAADYAVSTKPLRWRRAIQPLRQPFTEHRSCRHLPRMSVRVRYSHSGYFTWAYDTCWRPRWLCHLSAIPQIPQWKRRSCRDQQSTSGKRSQNCCCRRRSGILLPSRFWVNPEG